MFLQERERGAEILPLGAGGLNRAYSNPLSTTILLWSLKI